MDSDRLKEGQINEQGTDKYTDAQIIVGYELMGDILVLINKWVPLNICKDIANI